mmetsp:Transcript_34152/g.49574  ORF Transcript_34152/g.49574 Transcript_34152/m.49574 type:complete len:153 (-) Transcript_34152:247-705(-)
MITYEMKHANEQLAHWIHFNSCDYLFVTCPRSPYHFGNKFIVAQYREHNGNKITADNRDDFVDFCDSMWENAETNSNISKFFKQAQETNALVDGKFYGPLNALHLGAYCRTALAKDNNGLFCYFLEPEDSGEGPLYSMCRRTFLNTRTRFIK